MSRARYPLAWFSFHVGAVPWSVEFSHERATPQIRGCEGVTVHERFACYVHRKFMRRPEAAAAIAWHEMKHAIAWGAGLSIALYDGSDEHEERAIQLWTPAEFDTLTRAGLLTFPPIPEVRRRC